MIFFSFPPIPLNPRHLFLALTGLLLCFLLFPRPALADSVVIEVPSEARNAEAEAVAISKGFAQLLQRLSGDAEVEKDRKLMKQIGKPERYISSYYDKAAEAGEEGEASQPWVYVIEFETRELEPFFPDADMSVKEAPSAVSGESDAAVAVEALTRLADGSAVVASADQILLWVLVEPLDGQNLVLGEDGSSKWRDDVARAGKATGVSLLLPLMDAEDLSNVNASRILEADDFSLLRAARRYPVADVLGGVISQDSTGAWFTRLHRLGEAASEAYGDAERFSDSLAAALADLLGKGAPERAADSSAQVVMAAPGAEEASSFASEPADGSIRVTVRGVAGYGDYRRVLAALKANSHVESVIPKGSSAGSAEFELQLKGGTQAWLSSIDQNPESVLQSLSEPVQAELSHSQYYFRLK